MPRQLCSRLSLGRQTQVLALSCLDDKLRQRCLRLLSKICKARRIVPASYILQQELIRVGRVYCRGGFADVCDGEYLGSSVAIKRLRMEGDSDRVFKVLAASLVHPRCSVSTAALQGDHRLETPVAPKHTAFVGSFCVRRLMLFPDYHRVDAQRECDAVCKSQHRGKPAAIGVSVAISPQIVFMHQRHLAL
jgi:hypothetical protein